MHSSPPESVQERCGTRAEPGWRRRPSWLRAVRFSRCCSVAGRKLAVDRSEQFALRGNNKIDHGNPDRQAKIRGRKILGVLLCGYQSLCAGCLRARLELPQLLPRIFGMIGKARFFNHRHMPAAQIVKESRRIPDAAEG